MNSKTFQWAVIGAGPAGIAAIGRLLDANIKANDILWIDPKFTVGDLGLNWPNVSSNTKVKLFKKFLCASQAFDYNLTDNFAINTYPDNNTCLLKDIVHPLQSITNRLIKKTHSVNGYVTSLQLKNKAWQILTAEQTVFKALNVILAPGAEPTSPLHPDTDIIPLAIAIDKEKLISLFSKDETYAVFGASHSAILILKNLLELGAKKVINFYRTPCRYAVECSDVILFDNTGLKGIAAQFAKSYIDGAVPPNLQRYLSNSENLSTYMPQCDKAIYAIGFTPRTIQTIGYDSSQYNPHVGIIAPGLFGLGIAYPEIKEDSFGNIESRVGLWKFMDYLEKVLPIWFKYSTD